jgi:hypothetical protein
MIRGAAPDDICAFCDEFSVKQAAPEYAALGMGRCGVAEPGKPHVHTEWSASKCVSYRLDRLNLPARRQYVAQQRNKQQENT